MVKQLSLTLCLLCAMISQSASAQEGFECIEDTEKPRACDHFIIKKTDPRIARTSRIPNEAVCICISDFQTIINDIETQPSQTQQQILDEWQISRRDLNQLLRY